MFKVPTILTAEEILDKSFRKVSKVRGKGKNKITRIKNATISKLDAFAGTISSLLTKYVHSFPSIDRIHPFYAELLDVLIGKEELKKSLGALDWGQKKILSIKTNIIRQVSGARREDFIVRKRKEAFGRISSVVKQISKYLEFVAKARDELKRMPSIDPHIPTVVIAGYPNVGKSQLVKALSSAKPRIASYPFTTKRVSIGHFDFEGKKFQAIDTPGLLDRDMSKRNPIERQAIAALRHLAHIIVFILDPTGTCGYPLESQLNLLEIVKKQFPNTPTIVVENKSDLQKFPSGRLRISALTGAGVDELVSLLVTRTKSRVPVDAHSPLSR